MPSLPSYLEAAKPVPLASRLPWYKTIAPAYLGVMLWFVFWQSIVTAGQKGYPPGGILVDIGLDGRIHAGFLVPLFGLILAAVICHFLFYLVPGLLGMRTGLPLYVVGSSTYGARGGLYMPGFLMGILQFGWLGVNAFFVAEMLCRCFGKGTLVDESGKIIVTAPGWWHGSMASVFVILAAFVGLKGIRYVGRVGTYLNLIPVVVLIVLLVKTAGGISGFSIDKIVNPGLAPLPPAPGASMAPSVPEPAATVLVAAAADSPAAQKQPAATKQPAPAEAKGGAAPAAPATPAPAAPATPMPAKPAAPAPATPAPAAPAAPGAASVPPPADLPADVRSLFGGPEQWTWWRIIGLLSIYVVGFFATAGAAGVDIAMSSRSKEDVHIGGIFGILLPTVLAGGVAMLIVAGAYGGDKVGIANLGNLNPRELMEDILGSDVSTAFMIALAISAFPGACFSSFIAANSFKTTMPKINPFMTVGIGALISIALAVSGWAGDVGKVFAVIGASFGPVCGAMVADYLLAGRKWSGPRAGFNPAGWISWIIGFVVGGFNSVVALLLEWSWLMDKHPGWRPHLEKYVDYIYVPPVSAFVVGFGLYLLLSVIGARTKKLEMPGVAE